MKNPIIEKASEKFDELINKLFCLNINYQAFTTEQWNNEVAPILREIKHLITNPFN